MLIGSCLDDADVVAWAQCSRRSLQQLQRRAFLTSPIVVALELADPRQRHRAAFGVASSVTVRVASALHHQMSILQLVLPRSLQLPEDGSTKQLDIDGDAERAVPSQMLRCALVRQPLR